MISDIAFFSINSKLFWCIPCLHSFIQQTSRSSQDSVSTPCTPSANLSPSPTAPTVQAPSRRPEAGYSYSTPSISGGGKVWIPLINIAAFPLTNRLPSFWKKCLVDSSSSFPVHLSKALASFLIWSTDYGCHPLNVSAGRDMKVVYFVWF